MIALKIFRLSKVIIAGTAMLALSSIGNAQMINVEMPLQTHRDGFYERHGINFNMDFNGGSRIRGLSPTGQLLPRVQLSVGGFGSTAPSVPFYNPGNSLQTGLQTIGGDVNFGIGIELGKGSRRSSSLAAPNITLMNGQSGSIFSGVQRPFVTRIDPIIGQGWQTQLIRRPGPPRDPSDSQNDKPNGLMLQEPPAPRSYSEPDSSATRGAIGVAEIHRQKSMQAIAAQHELTQEAQQLVETAESLAQSGKYGAARAKYGRALRMISKEPGLDSLQQHIREQLEVLKGKR